jgi:hypothetical protein
LVLLSGGSFAMSIFGIYQSLAQNDSPPLAERCEAAGKANSVK